MKTNDFKKVNDIMEIQSLFRSNNYSNNEKFRDLNAKISCLNETNFNDRL